jgi:hypothetical protein
MPLAWLIGETNERTLPVFARESVPSAVERQLIL